MGWLSYDSVAETYERVAVPGFEPMALDLVAAVEISKAGSVLDVGAGTGLTAGLASAAVGSHGVVIGVDPSTAMLNLARARRRIIAWRPWPRACRFLTPALMPWSPTW
jgi:ubiquinone/menaquinone biosynthesis C-methylase UbiE